MPPFRRTRKKMEPIDDVRDRWLDGVGPRRPVRGGPVDKAGLALLSTLAAGRAPEDALARLGYEGRVEGWSLDELGAWVAQLATILGPAPARALRTLSAGIALGRGWSDALRRDGRARGGFDSATGLPALPVLFLRIEQVYEQCRALDVAPNHVYALVVVDPRGSGKGGAPDPAMQVLVAERTRAIFDSGETVCVAGNRVFVLASHGETLQARCERLLDDLSGLALLDSVAIRVESLPSTFDAVGPQLLDLAG